MVLGDSLRIPEEHCASTGVLEAAGLQVELLLDEGLYVRLAVG
jgi:hypothetical protein